MSKKLAAVGIIDGEYDVCVFLGRFRPLHSQHLYVILEALRCGKIVVIIVGSAFSARTERNPFNFHEVVAMIRGAIPSDMQDRLFIQPQRDRASNERWVIDVQTTVQTVMSNNDIAGTNETAKIALIGCAKDDTTFYLDLFPDWDGIMVPQAIMLSATEIREGLFQEGGTVKSTLAWLNTTNYILPVSTRVFLRDFVESEDYRKLAKEIDYYRKYRKPYREFQQMMLREHGFEPEMPLLTSDAVVIKSGKIALIERKHIPGAGLLALPGGFIQPGETHLKAVLRELREETRIKVPDAVLLGSLVHRERFEDRYRSSRGRVITEAFLFHLAPGGDFPRMSGRDDAKKAFWMPISEIRSEIMFDDHSSIIEKCLAVLDQKGL